MESSITHEIDGECIREWLLIGPFFTGDLGKDFLADVGGEANVEPKEDDTVTTSQGEILTWKRYESKVDVVYLFDAVGQHPYATAYAFCVLQSEGAGDAEIRLENNGDLLVWINEERVHIVSTTRRSTYLDQHVFEVSLRAGANCCLVKVYNVTNNWAFGMRVLALPPERAVISGVISNERGEAITHAHARLEQNGEKIAQTMTDDSGGYRLNIYPVRGPYDLSVVSGYLTDRQLGIRPDAGERRTLNITLKEDIGIEGTLLMLDDKTPHVSVPVQAICDGKVMATTLSDENGKYRFINLKPGQYQVRCQVLGGYVYYGEERRGKRENEKAGKRGKQKAGGRGDGDILRVESGKTLEDMDFRLAPFKKGTWKTYSYLDGLVGNTVRAVHFDPDGVVWFGTTRGVSRYEGEKFVNFATKDGLGHNDVHTIYSDPDGVMWFGTYRGGVSRYDGEEFVNYTRKDGLAWVGVHSIHRDLDGVMWFATSLGISRYDGKEFTNFTTENGLAHDWVRTIHQDPDGIMWFAIGGWTGGAGVARYDGKEFVNFTTKDGLAGNHVIAVYGDPDGIMWFGTDGGISRYDGEEFANLTPQDGLVHGPVDNRVWAIHRDPDGVMWFGTVYGVSRYDGKGFVNYTRKDGLADDHVTAIHHGTDGALWFATENGGVSQYDPNTFVSFSTEDGLADDNVHAIHSTPDGVIWFATGSGVSRYDGEEFINLTPEGGLSGSNVYAIHSDPDGIMWFGTDGGISRYDGEEFISLTAKDGLAGMEVHSIHSDPDGVMWFGTDDGISRYDGKEFINLTTRELGGRYINAIHRDPDGMMWFAIGRGSYGCVCCYDGNEFVRFTMKDGLAADSVVAIHCDPDGLIWFGTEDGASRYDGNEFINLTTEHGLAHGFVNAICRDSDGVMWFATQGGGISGYDGVAWTTLDTRDGLAGNHVSSILQDSDGSLWFGTNGGITRYRRTTTPPKARIVSVTTDQTYRLKTQDARLKTEGSGIPAFTIGTRVTIEYNAIDFKTVPEKRQYRCRVYETQDTRLKTQDEEPKTGDSLESWVLSPESNEPYNLPTRDTTFDWTPEEPGTYVFEVQAIDRDLNYSEPASVKLEVILDPRNHQIAQLKGELAERERAELERVHRELEDARQIQQALLPDRPPRIEGFEIAGISLPAREVSGDFYTYLSLDKNTGIVLADVTGKSVKAAMVAAMTSGMLHSEVEGHKDIWDSPAGILSRLNVRLLPHLVRGMYTAMSLSILRAEERQLVFSNAGMPYPIVKRGREVWELEVNGMPLGLMDRTEYQDLSADLEGGDFVVFHSDGVIEAENEAREMYQTERLLELVQEASSALSAQEMVDLIVGDVTAFAGGEEASDDITIVVIRCEGDGGKTGK